MWVHFIGINYVSIKLKHNFFKFKLYFVNVIENIHNLKVANSFNG